MPAIRCHNDSSSVTNCTLARDGNAWLEESEAEENELMIAAVLAANASDNSSPSPTAVSSPATNWTEVFLTLNSGGPTQSAPGGGGGGGGFGAEVMIPLYSVIFLLSVVGNIMVIVTLTQNRRMRTVTNVFLLNLAVADLLLGVFCMPFTLIGQLLRDFIFGSFMCKIIPYFQAVSVSVGVWTLVAISLERYFAICRPLKSRIWQTRSHAYKMIVAVWVFSLSLCLPVAFLSRLKPIRETGRHKCREEWPDDVSEKAYNLLLNGVLLVLPLLIMGIAYWLIAARLWKGLRNIETAGGRFFRSKTTNTAATSCSIQQQQEEQAMVTINEVTINAPCGSSCTEVMIPEGVSTITNSVTNQAGTSHGNDITNGGNGHGPQSTDRNNHRRLCCATQSLVTQSVPTSSAGRKFNRPQHRFISRQSAGLMSSPTSNRRTPPTFQQQPRAARTASVQIMDQRAVGRHGVRSTYTDKSVWAKKKVIRMLFVIVFEFFLCWAPLYVINTWYAFDPVSLYKQMGATEISLIQLLAYLSSCCNPITYCFMNEKFRNAFLSAFGCGPQGRFGRGPNRSTDLVSGSLNDSVNLGRRPYKGNARVTSNVTATSTTNMKICETSLIYALGSNEIQVTPEVPIIGLQRHTGSPLLD